MNSVQVQRAPKYDQMVLVLLSAVSGRCLLEPRSPCSSHKYTNVRHQSRKIKGLGASNARTRVCLELCAKPIAIMMLKPGSRGIEERGSPDGGSRNECQRWKKRRHRFSAEDFAPVSVCAPALMLRSGGSHP